MEEHKRIENGFTWKPLNETVGRFGFALSTKKETRRPILWLVGKSNDGKLGREMYLVNLSDEILDFVVAGSGGCQTTDEGAMAISDNGGVRYENVKPNEAVLVEYYDEYYDLDYLLQISLEVKSAKLGHIQILSPADKGGVKTMVLLWDDGESGKYVNVTEL